MTTGSEDFPLLRRRAAQQKAPTRMLDWLFDSSRLDFGTAGSCLPMQRVAHHMHLHFPALCKLSVTTAELAESHRGIHPRNCVL